MTRLALVFLIVLALIATTGCKTNRSQIVSPGIHAVNNVKSGGNVSVHISNQSGPTYASIDFAIRREGDEHWSGWGGGGEIEFDPHGYVTFMFVIPPGSYELVLDDGITSEPWVFSFTVTDKPTHLNTSYRLAEDWSWKPETNHSPRVYHGAFKCEVSDSEPVVF